MPTPTTVFSIANFKKLFNESPARKYMSDMDIQQVETAIEEKDAAILGQLYEMLLHAQATDEKIVRDFVITKNRLMDDFKISAQDKVKKMVEGPRKEKTVQDEQSEKEQAEQMLNQAFN